MNEHPQPFAFPDISDEAAIAVNHFLKAFYTHFQHHYFAQLHRYYAELPNPARYNDQLPLPLDDPPL